MLDDFTVISRWLKIVKWYPSTEHMEAEMAKVETNEVGPEEKTFKNQQETAVRNTLAALKDTWRIPLILYYYREFSLVEISQMLEIPEGTVKSRLAVPAPLKFLSLKAKIRIPVKIPLTLSLLYFIVFF